jgi:hypothetical protein
LRERVGEALFVEVAHHHLAVEREDLRQAGLVRFVLQDAGYAVAQQSGAAGKLERKPLRRPDDRRGVGEEGRKGAEDGIFRRTFDELWKSRWISDFDTAEPFPVPYEQKAVVIREHPVRKRFGVPKPLLGGLEPPAEVRAGRLRLHEADQPRPILDEDVGLTRLLGIGLRRDQQVAARVMRDLAEELQHWLSQRQLGSRLALSSEAGQVAEIVRQAILRHRLDSMSGGG